MIGGALRRIVTFKSKHQFLPSNAPYWTPDGRVRPVEEEAVQKVQKKLGSEKAIQEIRKELEKMKQENQELKSP